VFETTFFLFFFIVLRDDTIIAIISSFSVISDTSLSSLLHLFFIHECHLYKKFQNSLLIFFNPKSAIQNPQSKIVSSSRMILFMQLFQRVLCNMGVYLCCRNVRIRR
jgi:hypothetical protein